MNSREHTVAPPRTLSASRSVLRSRFSGTALCCFAAWWCSGCLVGSPAAGLPSRHQVQQPEFAVHSDFKLPKGHPLIGDLTELRKEIVRQLDLPEPRQNVEVYVFANEERYRQYLQATYPQLPHRRAYFVGTTKELAVYTYWGERLQEDLRHEYTHGVLHACLKDVPLWLDEGLAEYFEVSGPTGSLHQEYSARLAEMVQRGWRPNIERLESLEAVSSMHRGDYQEAWAWTHYMLHGGDDGRMVLKSYLSDLRDNPRPESLAMRLRREVPNVDQRLVAYVSSLSVTNPALAKVGHATVGQSP